MIGVLIVAGIIGYGIMYAGLSHLPHNSIPPTDIAGALWPKAAQPKGFPKAGKDIGQTPGAPRRGRV